MERRHLVISAGAVLCRLADGEDAHALGATLLADALDGGSFERSVSNCHHDGVDSVVLADDTATDGGMIRFFFARHDRHTLDALIAPSGHYTIGVHDHRYPLALIPLTGTIINHRVWLRTRPTGPTIHEYRFRSALADDDAGQVAVEHVAERGLADTEDVRLDPGGAAALMYSQVLHTVVVPKDSSPGTAWLVVEGPQVQESTRIYSPRPDLTVSSEGLYVPMSPARARVITEGVWERTRRG